MRNVPLTHLYMCNAHFVSEEQATANAIDTDSKGKVIFKWFMHQILIVH